MHFNEILPCLQAALTARSDLLAPPHEYPLRLFAGFYEGCPQLVADVYGKTLLLFNYADPPESGADILQGALNFYRSALPWLESAVVKPRNAAAPQVRRGQVLFGVKPQRKVRENGVWYALDLLLNQDASFYLDTRGLRTWLQTHSAGKAVLNTFAYTGSLGVAALAGGAQRVVQLDLNRAYLNLAKTSCACNGLPVVKGDYLYGDFFALASRLRRAKAAFDIAILDPPIFTQTQAGTVDLYHQAQNAINKIRPLVNDDGYLVTINNALFLPGADYIRLLENLCADGFLAIEALIPAPDDITGYPSTRQADPPAAPAPFNHPTKIAVLRVKKRA
jgi:23S rRNA (cytosine1962-C5)-methyltransferase